MVAAADEPPRRPRLPSPADKRITTAAAAAATADSNGHAARRRSLHNFSFPPTLSWGNQRVLRCVNHPSIADASAGNVAAAASPSTNNQKSSSESDPKPKLKLAEEDDESSPSRPWNLRTRRANLNRMSNPSSSAANPNPNRSSSSSPSPPSPTILQVEKGRSGGGGGQENNGWCEGERCKFSVALTSQEIEEDFLKMKGSKPPRRPKKRAKYIQRQLDSLFPGLWLSEITPDLYKIEVEKT